MPFDRISRAGTKAIHKIDEIDLLKVILQTVNLTFSEEFQHEPADNQKRKDKKHNKTTYLMSLYRSHEKKCN